jgi:Ca2+-binding RTX toxin-like protein
VANLGNGPGAPDYDGSFAEVYSGVPSSISATLNGGTGADTLYTYQHPADQGNTLNGGAGDDYLEGAQGDTLNAGDGNSELFIYDRGVTTPSTLNGGSGNDSLYSSVSGNDTLNANNGNSSLHSYAGPNTTVTMNGGPGSNTFYGSIDCNAPKCGPDQMNGGSGDDTFYPGSGAANIVGGGGNNLVNWGYYYRPQGVSNTLDNQPNDGVPGQGANVHSDVQDVIGTSHADYIVGSATTSDYILGNGGKRHDQRVQQPRQAGCRAVRHRLCHRLRRSVRHRRHDGLGRMLWTDRAPGGAGRSGSRHQARPGPDQAARQRSPGQRRLLGLGRVPRHRDAAPGQDDHRLGAAGGAERKDPGV